MDMYQITQMRQKWPTLATISPLWLLGLSQNRKKEFVFHTSCQFLSILKFTGHMNVLVQEWRILLFNVCLLLELPQKSLKQVQ
jgi:hypothetical protein